MLQSPLRPSTAKMLSDSWSAWSSSSYRPVGPAWLQIVWTFVFSMLVAAGFTVIGFAMYADGDGAWRNWSAWGAWYLRFLVVSLAVGYAIQGLFMLGIRWVGRARIARFTRWQRAAYFSALPIGGTAIGVAIGLNLIGVGARPLARGDDANSLVGSILLSVLGFCLFSIYFTIRHQKLRAERAAAQAQLKLLQAQMEPHFLFNTLANVLSLMEADAPRARRMLESFTDYLRASLGSMREAEHTLGAELALVEAYLGVVKTRMEDRLHYRIAVPDTLRSLMLPALSLQPLVENAVVHGLEPTIDGGTVLIEARIESDVLVLCVTDDGIGLEAARRSGRHGTGTALGNLTERLRQQGADGSGALTVADAPTRGVRSTLHLPLPPAVRATPAASPRGPVR